MKTIPDSDFYAIVRARAVQLASRRKCRTVSTDDLHAYCHQQGIQPRHQNLWGNVFRTGDWEEVACRQSSLPSRRGGRRCDWRLSGGAA